MKKWMILAGAGAAAAVAVLATKKKPADKAAPKAKGAAPKSKKPEIKNPQVGTYSFVSGYKDAATVDVAVKYDADRVDFSVIEEGFLVDSSDSHVAVVYNGMFTLQMEYAGYYSGDDFASLAENAKVKFKEVGDVAYGETKGIKYLAGDAICMCFPVDEFSYLLLTVMKGPDNDDAVTDLPANDELALFLENLSVTINK